MSIRSRLNVEPLLNAKGQLDKLRDQIKKIGQFTHEEEKEATYVLNVINSIDSWLDILRDYKTGGTTKAVLLDTIEKANPEDCFDPTDSPSIGSRESL